MIVMIGDGMGNAHLHAASYFRHGRPGRLVLETLPIRVEVETGSLSGTTDSAAAATAMSTGRRVYNGQIGIDRDGNDVETAVELAHRQGLAAGIVATSAITDATPAAFTAHASSRIDQYTIAEAEARARPEVVLGGGRCYFEGPALDGSTVAVLSRDGYDIVRSADELAASRAPRVLGLFADSSMTYQVRRSPSTTEPTLSQMTRAALARLDTDPDGFLLVVEGSRIDTASHNNAAAEMIGEVLEFDDTARVVMEWSSGRPEVTLIVTADHECGGLEVTNGKPAGTLPDVAWRVDAHTGAAVTLYARGPGVEALPPIIDHRWVHAILKSRLTMTPFERPSPVE